MNLKILLKCIIPPFILNRFLLTFPILYKTKIVNYESNLIEGGGINDLLFLLNQNFHLDGNIIECGSSRCGTSIIMANRLNLLSSNKLIYAYDSFSGFDQEELRKEKKRGYTNIRNNAFTSTSYNYVKKKIKKLNLENTIIPIKGFFQDVLSKINSKTCLALIDCDLEKSTLYCAITIWPDLVRDGYLVFDDYKNLYFKGVKKAVDSFIRDYQNEILRHGMLNRLYYIQKK